MKKNAGYTVIELLAVVTILVVVMGIIAALITQTLRGTSKTNITNRVSQTGNYVSSVISNTVLTAEDVVAVNGADISDCTQNPTGSSIELLISEREGTIIYACVTDINGDDIISSNSASLIDVSSLRVDLATCSFTCSQENNDPYTPPIIEFKFELTQKNEDALFESRSSSPFNTSVLMRNYSPKYKAN